MNKQLSSLRPVLLALCLLLLWLVTLPASAQEGTPPTTPPINGTQPLQDAWALAQASGSYQYRSLVEQTSYPAPSLTNAGRTTTNSTFGAQGSVNLAAETIQYFPF